MVRDQDFNERGLLHLGANGFGLGLIIDERATDQQQEAIAAIVSGGAGGPMVPLTGLIGTFLGIERAPITLESDGVKWSTTTDGLVDMAAEGVMGIDPRNPEPLTIDNTGHPVNRRLALARALRSHVHALGLDWDDTSGKNNGHYAPFEWSNAA